MHRIKGLEFGVVIIAAMPVLLLRSMFSDFGSGASILWLNPRHVAAGFGFAGLALALAIAAVVHLVEVEGATEGEFEAAFGPRPTSASGEPVRRPEARHGKGPRAQP